MKKRIADYEKKDKHLQEQADAFEEKWRGLASQAVLADGRKEMAESAVANGNTKRRRDCLQVREQALAQREGWKQQIRRLEA